MSYDMIVALLKLISCDCDSDSETKLKLHVSSELKESSFDDNVNEIQDLIIKAFVRMKNLFEIILYRFYT